ncbi:MAG: pyridoxal phosphate-dependent aminotransferase [Bifidobacteriaceae bacterium]|nr:pyridoxal phosphate-dependent aminotransferase [Bifidobacteriaceae bacterium]
MRIAERAGAGRAPNALALSAARLRAEGVQLTDLTDTNPTRHGLADPAVWEAVAMAARGAPRYEPEPRGPLVAREALAEHFGGGPGEYWLTASTSEAYSWLLTLLAEPGGQVAVPRPGYPLVEPLARLAGVKAVGYPLHYVAGHGWIYDLAGFEAAATGAAAAVLVNPGNPTGSYLSAGTAAQVAAVAKKRDSALIVDQVFYSHSLESGGEGGAVGEAGNPIEVWDSPAAPLRFRLDGLTKLVCGPGLKLAWIRLAGPKPQVRDVAAALDNIADTFLPVSSAIALALPQILERAHGVVAAVRARLRQNLAALRSGLGDERVRIIEGGWVAIVDLDPPGGGQDLAQWLLEREHLAVHPGWFYDLADASAIVVSLLPSPDEFAANVARLAAAAGRLAVCET